MADHTVQLVLIRYPSFPSLLPSKPTIPSVQIQIIVFMKIVSNVEIGKSIGVHITHRNSKSIPESTGIDTRLLCHIRKPIPIVPEQAISGLRIGNRPKYVRLPIRIFIMK